MDSASEVMKLEVIARCSDGTQILKGPGGKSPHDFKIYIKFPSSPWPLSYEIIGTILSIAGGLEDINYPPPYKGRKMLADFVVDCMNGGSVEETMRRYKL